MDIEKLMQTYPNLTDVHATQDEPLMIRAGGALKKLRETAGEDFFTALFTSYVNEDRMTAYKKEEDPELKNIFLGILIEYCSPSSYENDI